ncbi:MAG: hypothetical protein ACI94Y_002607 [Maribacter sp.]
MEFCNDICDAFFNHAFNECTGEFSAQTFLFAPWVPYEWYVDGNLVGTTPDLLIYTLSPGTHEVCGMTYDECLFYNCEWCVTVTVLDNTDCNAPFTYNLDPNTGEFFATSASQDEWFVDGLQAGVGYIFTTILSPGVHDIIHFGTSACGQDCEYLETVTVIGNNPCTDPFSTVIITTGDTLDCNNPTIGFEAVSNPPPSFFTNYTYEWAGPGIVGGNTSSSGTTIPGTFEVIVTDGNGCTSMASILIYENFTIPNISINVPTTVLTNNVNNINLEVIGTGNYTYNWWQMNNNTSTLNVTEPGVYTVYVGNLDNGCGTQASITITEDLPCDDFCDAYYTYNFNECTGVFEGYPIQTLPFIPYEWYVDGNLIYDDSDVIDTLNQGTHEICLMTYDECLTFNCEWCETVIVLDDSDCNAPFTYNLDPNTGEFLATSASSEEWFVDGLQAGQGNIFTTTLSPGVHSITHFGSSTCGQDCEYIETVTVIGNDPCTNNQLMSFIIATDQTLTCNVQTIGFEVISNPPPNFPTGYTYEWSGPGVLGSNTASAGTTIPGTFEVTVTNNLGCSSTAIIEIEEDYSTPDVSIYVPTTVLPLGTSLNLEVIGTGNYAYEWQGMNNTTSTLNVTEPGTYIVYIINLDNGCWTQEAITITQDTPCDDVIECDAIFTYSYTYEFNGAYNLTVYPLDNFMYGGYIEINGLEQTAGQANFILQPEATYSICYYTYGNLGCEFCAGCQTVIINTIPCSNPFSANITASSTVATCINPTVSLEVSTVPNPANPSDYTYEWSGSASGFTGYSIPVIPTVPETFTVTITDLLGCTTTASVFIDTDFNIPNVFIDAATTVLTNTVTSIDLEVIGTGNYTYNWGQNNTTSTLTITEPGSYLVYVADANSGCGIDVEITITEDLTGGCDYELGELELNCDFSTNDVLCMPLLAKNNVPNGIIGMDFCMTYNAGLMIPTGNVELGAVVLNGNPNASYAINTSLASMVCVTIYYTSDAPVGTDFVGSGEIACVEFAPLSTFFDGQIIGQPINTGFGMDNLIESYELSIVQGCADEGTATMNQNETIMEANIRYWDDYALPLAYDVNYPSANLITNIIGTDANCTPLANAPIVTPDLLGHFQYDINNGTSISLERDINNGTQVMPTINGMDCYYAHLVTTLDPSFTPSPYQIIAMDVNMNGSVTAGDITHMQNRITLNIGEYPQVWNDNIADASKDWLFVDDATLTSSNYSVSNSYPFDDGTGFNRLNVPQPDFCYEISMVSNGVCTQPDSTNYHAILLGDTDKSWTTNITNLRLGEDTQVVLNIDEAVIIEEECSLLFPIRVEDMETVKAIDFVMEYNTLKLAFDGYVYGDNINTNEMGMAYNQIENSDILFTSYSKTQQGIENNNTIYYYAKFSILNEDENIFSADISFKQSFVDGLPSPNTVTGTEASCRMNINDEVSFSIYPNPFNGRFSIKLKGYPQDTEFTLFFYDVAGKLIDARRFTDTFYDYENHNLAKGVYLYELKVGKELVEAGRLISQ